MKRRQGTVEKKIRLTPDALVAIEQWADQNNASFSAAIETLARLGLGEPAATALTPALASSIRRELLNAQERLAGLIAHAGKESGVAARLAGAALYVLQPEDAEALEEKARAEAGRRLNQLKTGALLESLYQERQRMLAEDAGEEDALNDEDAAGPTDRAEDEELTGKHMPS